MLHSHIVVHSQDRMPGPETSHSASADVKLSAFRKFIV